MRLDAAGFPISFDVDGVAVLLVGDDEDAARKRSLLEEGGAVVTQIAPGAFEDGAVDGARLVLLTARDRQLAGRVSAAARARGVLAWCSDDPARSDFAMPAIARMGNVRIAIATAGGSPALASRMRALFETQLGERFAEFAQALAERRAERSVEERRADLDGFDVEVRVHYPDWFK
jgi:siroheme synthase (precorrin-2 oxidase/ferrochelatase)